MFILLSKATCVAIYLIYCNHLIYSFCIRSDHIGKTIWKKKQNPKENSFVNSDKTITSLLVMKHSKHHCLLWFINNIFSHSFLSKFGK